MINLEDKKMKNNKKQTNRFLTFFLSLILIYLMASASMWDFNPSHWNKAFTSMLAIFSCCIIMLSIQFKKLN